MKNEMEEEKKLKKEKDLFIEQKKIFEKLSEEEKGLYKKQLYEEEIEEEIKKKQEQIPLQQNLIKPYMTSIKEELDEDEIELKKKLDNTNELYVKYKSIIEEPKLYEILQKEEEEIKVMILKNNEQKEKNKEAIELLNKNIIENENSLSKLEKEIKEHETNLKQEKKGKIKSVKNKIFIKHKKFIKENQHIIEKINEINEKNKINLKELEEENILLDKKITKIMNESNKSKLAEFSSSEDMVKKQMEKQATTKTKMLQEQARLYKQEEEEKQKQEEIKNSLLNQKKNKALTEKYKMKIGREKRQQSDIEKQIIKKINTIKKSQRPNEAVGLTNNQKLALGLDPNENKGNIAQSRIIKALEKIEEIEIEKEYKAEIERKKAEEKDLSKKEKRKELYKKEQKEIIEPDFSGFTFSQAKKYKLMAPISMYNDLEADSDSLYNPKGMALMSKF